MRRTESGFSLIELLVVITILAALAAGGTIWIKVTQKQKAKAVTNQRMVAIATGLDEVKQAMGYYPPSYTSELRAVGTSKEKPGEKVGTPNETNVGIETVYVSFHLPGVNISSMDDLGDDAIANTDDDQANELVGQMTTLELFEFVDYWGNPFVYFANKDYKDPGKVEKYVKDDETTVTVAVRVREKTGAFQRAQSFQLFSMGEDGVPGTDDDLAWGN